MMKLAALALVLSTSACAMTPEGKHVGYASGAAMVATGLIVSLAFAPHVCREPTAETSLGDAAGCLASMQALYAIGWTIATGGIATLVGTAIAREVPDQPVEVSADPTGSVAIEPVPDTSNPVLRQLTTKASIAAHVGRCDEVEQIAAQVQAIDHAYRYGGFVTAGTISDCL